ncbi:hypothetical protein ACFOUP_18795 [Belliella kenyensis]|uniref:NigD-like protein n=1 Tax=Belliella kenyensis TaxID=1472724 RepID=A0ABV8ES74_9BACT|nr:hypothetical protein [Belliella kenyensis]MCH7402174.1 hypothetical protein [Belliella kenyensis]MDN3601689.1 hypothetical protein [Belliella kenyensis]
MRSPKLLFYALIFAFSLNACISPPDDFPTVPEIAFEGMEFVNTSGSDSLIVSISFKDQEGDLGLNATDLNPPFNELIFKRDNTGALITYSQRPPEAPSYNPLDWSIRPRINNVVLNDTVWVEINPNHFNIFVKFFIKRNGIFNEFRWEDPPFFTTFNGRFPRILPDNRTQGVEGTIRYSMRSFGWESIFRNDTIRIDVQIQDRALNRSNIASSPELTLRQITRN